VPVTKLVMGAGEVDRGDAAESVLLVEGRLINCIIKGELLSGEEVSDSRT
jgi:hypothetical protein